MEWREKLKTLNWEEGRAIHLPPSSYRHQVVITCYNKGRQTAEFANGSFNYGAYVKLVRPDGSWIAEGNSIVPVLPDGRIIMVVEQRPPQEAPYGFRPAVIERNEQESINLAQFGPFSSLEFPGGGVGLDEQFSSGFLRELVEETGIENQTAKLVMRNPWLYPAGADVALRSKIGVIYLSGYKFEGYVENDGGLNVIAMTPSDIQLNIWNGGLASVQTVHLGWSFYKELQAGDDVVARMEALGYVTRQTVKIKK